MKSDTIVFSETRVIKTEEQYHLYLSEVEYLLAQSDTMSPEQNERLDLLTLLIESYESSNYPIEPPDPIDAIKFRMDQQNLKQIDLVPYFGTRGRVSEVLNRKRPLTIPMIRSLAVGLGISTETLVGLSSDEPNATRKSDVDWAKFPAKEMIARGWIAKVTDKKNFSIESQVQQFISNIGWNFGDAAFKRSISGDAYSAPTKYALYAWLARVVQKSRSKRKHLADYDENLVSESTLRELAQLSWFEEGPLLAVEFLQKIGISVVIEPHLRGTLLDGAALKDSDGTPIIALTLRHDRLDNFWFTLLHEAVHIWKHVGQEETFLDDLDSSSQDQREAEANRIARDSLVPRVAWRRSEVSRNPTESNILSLSRELKINPAIIAGRVRRESGNHRIFSQLVGYGDIRKLFSE